MSVRHDLIANKAFFPCLLRNNPTFCFFLDFGAAMVLLICILIYFPSKVQIVIVVSLKIPF